MENELENIITTERLTLDEIYKLYNKGKINLYERKLLSACRNEAYLNSFLCGVGVYKLSYDNTVRADAYFTNIDAVLGAFYSLYKKYPDYHFDKVLEYGLTNLAEYSSETYEFLTYMYAQINNEKDKVSPFEIKKVELLEKSKKILKDPSRYEMFLEEKEYLGKDKEEGQISVFKNYNETFKKEIGFDLFEEEEEK